MNREDISSLARELGIRKELLYKWRSVYRKKGEDSFPGNGHSCVTDESKLIESLRKAHARILKENEILKKALGIISKGTDL